MKIRIKNSLIISGIIMGALWISGCTPIISKKVADTSNVKFPTIDCINAQPVKMYTKNELNVDSLLTDTKKLENLIASFSKFQQFKRPLNISDKVNASGISVKVYGSDVRIAYINGYSENLRNSSISFMESLINFLNPFYSGNQRYVSSILDRNTIYTSQPFNIKISNDSPSNVEYSSLFSQLFSQNRPNRETTINETPYIVDRYSVVEYQLSLKKKNDTSIDVELNSLPIASAKYFNVAYLGDSKDATREDVENIFKKFEIQLNFDVNNIYKGSKNVIKTLYVRPESIEYVLLKNGYKLYSKKTSSKELLTSLINTLQNKDSKKDSGVNKSYIKTINIKDDQSIDSIVNVSCPVNANCSVEYENQIKNYVAYSNGECSITPSIFATESEKLNVSLRNILELD